MYVHMYTHYVSADNPLFDNKVAREYENPPKEFQKFLQDDFNNELDKNNDSNKNCRDLPAMLPLKPNTCIISTEWKYYFVFVH